MDKYTANINAPISDALNVAHDETTAYAIFNEVDLTVENGHGIRANAKVKANETSTVTVNRTATITINGDSSSSLQTPSAVYAGDSARYFSIFGFESGSKTLGHGDVYLNGDTFINLNGKGNYGIYAGKNGSISVKNLQILSQGADSYGVVARSGNITYADSLDNSTNWYGSTVTLSGDQIRILMQGENGTALWADSAQGKIVSKSEGFGTLAVRGDVVASQSGTIDLTVKERSGLEGSVRAESAGTILLGFHNGFDLSAKTGTTAAPEPVLFAGDAKKPNTKNESSLRITYQGDSSLHGDMVASAGGTIQLKTTGSGTSGSALHIKGDGSAFNGGTVDLALGDGSYWEGRLDDYINLSDPQWAAEHARLFAPQMDDTLKAPGTLKVDLGTRSTLKLTGQSWVTSLRANESVIDLATADGKQALHIGELSGTNNSFVMNLARDGQGNMLYIGKGSVAKQNLVIANPDEVLSMANGERIRFATIGQAGKGFEDGSVSDIRTFGTRTAVKDVGIFNVGYDIVYEDRKDDSDNEDYDGGQELSLEKPGSEYVASYYDTEKGSQNVYLVRNGEATFSHSAQAVQATARSLYWNSIEMDRFNKRMVDLHHVNGSGDGLWVRARTDRIGTAAASGNFRSRNYGYQLGFDHQRAEGSGVRFFGAAIDYMDGNTNYQDVKGSGDTDRLGLTAYMSWVGDSGTYYDLVGKWGRLSNSFDIKTGSGFAVTSDYDNHYWGGSVEFGRKLSQPKSSWFLEPQAQIQYVQVGSADYRTSQGSQIQQKAIHSAVTRLGFRVGRTLGSDLAGVAYFKSDWLKEWSGRQRIFARDITTANQSADISIDNKGDWFDVGAGVQTMLGSRISFFADAEYLFGHELEKTWVFNLGLRWQFR